MASVVATPMTMDNGWLVDINTEFSQGMRNFIIYNVEVINSEILNVLTTLIGEEWFEPTYGSNVPNRVFDPINEKTAWFLEHDIQDALNLWVPQVKVDSQKTRAYPNPDQRYYDTYIYYEVVAFAIQVAYRVQLGPAG